MILWIFFRLIRPIGLLGSMLRVTKITVGLPRYYRLVSIFNATLLEKTVISDVLNIYFVDS